MMVTGQKVITDVIALLRQTELPSVIGGGIYRQGTRPRDSRAEDLVVIFTTGDAGQFQKGLVTLNIYVPDIGAVGSDGVNYEDSARCEEIEAAALKAVESLRAYKSDYLFRLRDAIFTQRDESINQSFVVVRLGFKYIV